MGEEEMVHPGKNPTAASSDTDASELRATPSRLIISGDLNYADEAFALLCQQAAEFYKYDRIGWGWSFGPYDHETQRSRFFVRRIKDGLSCTIAGRAKPEGKLGDAVPGAQATEGMIP